MIRLPPKVQRGQRILATDWNKIREGLQAALNMRGGKGISIKVDPGGIVISLAKNGKKWRDPCIFVRAWNVGEETAFPLEVGMLTWPWQLQTGTPPEYTGQPLVSPGTNDGDITRYFTDRVVEARRPLDSCFGRFGIWIEKVDPGDTGMMLVSGICIAYLTRSGVTQDNYELADRADTLAGSPFLQLSELGAAQVLWYDDGYSEGDPYPAIVKIDSRNTMGTGIQEDGSNTNRGVAEVLVFDSSVVLSYDDEKAGIVRVERVP